VAFAFQRQRSSAPTAAKRSRKELHSIASNGDLCVLDWEKAYLAGAVKKDDVPEQFIWWKDEVKRKTGIASAAAQIKSDV
jgi:hypothetical protein